MSTRNPVGSLAALSDSALVPLVREGDEAAFATIDSRHRARMTRRCLGILRDPHDAEEAVQNAMLSAYRSIVRGTSPESPGSWLLAICTNEAYDLIRRRRPTVELSGEIVASQETAHDRVERKERMDSLRGDLAALPEAQRHAFVLRGFADLPHADIARALGGTPQEMRTLVHEARATLEEFDAGRNLDCAIVRERIDTGDGRALRARRVRAHLRSCDGCRVAATTGTGAGRRARLRSFLPLPALASLLRSLFAGSPSAVVGAAGGSAAAIASAVILAGGGSGAVTDRPAILTGSQPAARSAPAVAGGAKGATSAARAGSARGPAVGGLRSSVPAAAGGPEGSGDPSAPSVSPAPSPEPGQAESGSVQGPGASRPTVSVPPVSVPPVTVPSVRVPSVRVPSVRVPSVTVPPVEAPPLPGVGSITTPPITTPPITTPSIATPSIATPPLPTPAVPLTGVTVPGITVAIPPLGSRDPAS